MLSDDLDIIRVFSKLNKEVTRVSELAKTLPFDC